MAISSKHPQWAAMNPDWIVMRDTKAGQRQIKERGPEYLPMTSGMIADGGLTTVTSIGYRAFEAYVKRSVFPDLVSDAIRAMLGVMHHKPPVIELPTEMEPMLENATLQNEPLDVFLQRINEEQLTTGRCGLLVDLPETPVDRNAMPYIAMYAGETIINWDTGQKQNLESRQSLNLVVLDETGAVRVNDFEWEDQEAYRVLVLGAVDTNEPAGASVYKVGKFIGSNATFNEADLAEPTMIGQTFDEVPFTFINSKDIVPQVYEPPLLGLANACLTIYRGEADYRQSLFMQGQDTLVVIGGNTSEDDTPVRVGANAQISLPAEGDAKFIGVDSTGLTEQREALGNDHSRAAQKGTQLLDSTSREKESGDALKIRVAASTATLNQIALAGAAGLENSLKQIARWRGLNPDEVIVEPNLDFVDDQMTGRELTDLTTAKNVGAPIASQTIHRNMQDRGLTDLTYDEEQALIEAEAPAPGTTNPDALQDDDDDNDDE